MMTACDRCMLTPVQALFCQQANPCPKGYQKATGDIIMVGGQG